MSRLVLLSACSLTSFALSLPTAADDWARFRGPNGTGIAADGDAMPAHWDSETNLKWKVALPGPGSSSPIIVGEKVFVTCWSGYGIDTGDPGEQEQLRRHLICLDFDTGDVIWDKAVVPYLPEDNYGGMFAEHGYASHTPVSDGEHVFVFFGKTGAMAFDMEGNELWQKNLGTESDPRGWGSASSPILYDDLLIVTASAESEALAALDEATGEVVWRKEATGFNGVWGTPVVVEAAGGQTDLVIAVPGEIWGFAPETGDLRWYCTSPTTSSFCSSAVAHNGIVYAMETGPGGGGGIAVRAGGSGDVTESHVVWTGQQSNRIGTPLMTSDRLYAFSRGVASCFDAHTGEQVFRSRLKSSGISPAGGGRGRRGRGGGQDYSSPVLADGKIYFTSRGGDVYVIRAGDEFEQLAVNRVTNDPEDFSATPAVSDGHLLIRSSKHLYCVAQLAEGDEQQKVAEATRVDASDTEDVDEGEDDRRGRGRFDPVEIFNRRDADGDGKLAGDEISGRMQDRLEQLDADGDGAITLEEFQTGIRRIFGGGRGGRRGDDDREGRPQRPT